MRTIRFTALSTLALAACMSVEPQNPLDPDAPEGVQARATLTGNVVLAETGATVAGLSVRLRDRSGAMLLDENGAERVAQVQPGEGDGLDLGTGTFELRNLPAGSYLPVIDVDARFSAPPITEIAVLPGEKRFAGTYRYVVAEVGVGRVHGSVGLERGSGGARKVRLSRLRASGYVVVAERLTAADGSFDFTGLAQGTYAVIGELDGYAPDYRTKVELQDGPGQLVESTPVNLTLRPAAGVVVPELPNVYGAFYTSARTLPVHIYRFGQVDEMRVVVAPVAQLTEGGPAFVDDAGAELPFQTYEPTLTVPLPDVEGPLAVVVQFRDTTDQNFPFVSGAFSRTVVRDATKPVVTRVSAPGLVAAADGATWTKTPGATLTLEIEANDVQAGVADARLLQRADNGEGTPEELGFAQRLFPAGVVQVSEQVGLTAGEGEKVVWARAIDRAGNVSDPVPFVVGVDATPPTFEVSINEGAGYALSQRVRVALALEEGGAPVTELAFSPDGVRMGLVLPSWNVGSVEYELDNGAATEDGRKEVHVRVTDAAGNVGVGVDDVVLDRVDPTLALALEGGAAYATSRTIAARVTGVADTGAVVAVKPGSDCGGASFVPFDGDETITVELADVATAQVVTACVREPSGRVAATRASISYDGVAPAAPAPLSPAHGAWSRSSAPTLSWTASEDATAYELRIVRGTETVFGPALIAGTSWTPPAALPDADFAWSVVAVDAAGNRSAAGAFPRTVRIDTAAPTGLDGLAISGGSPTRASRPTLSWSAATDERTTASELVYVLEVADGESFSATVLRAEVTGATSYPLATPLSDGTHAWRVTVRDAAGNTALVTGPSVTVDTTPPAAPFLQTVPSPTPGPLALAWTAVTGADDYRVVATRAPGQSDAACGVAKTVEHVVEQTSDTVTLARATGCTWVIAVSARDALGNESIAATATVFVDDVAPGAPAFVEGSGWTSGVPTLRWTAVDGATAYRVRIRQGATVVRGPKILTSTQYTETIALPDADYVWEVEALDAAGNGSGYTGTGFPAQLRVDTTPPTGLGSLSITGGTPTSERRPEATWSRASDPSGRTPTNQLRYVLELATGSDFATTVLRGELVDTTSFRAPILADGSYAWRVTVRDLAGNATTVVGPALTIDATAPAAPSFEPVVSPTTNPVTLSWSSVADAASYRIVARPALGADLVACGNPGIRTLDTTTTTVTVSLPQTASCRYVASVVALDALSNASDAATTTFVLDTQAPRLPTTGNAVLIEPIGPGVGAPATANEIVTIAFQATDADSMQLLVEEGPSGANGTCPSRSPPLPAAFAPISVQSYVPATTFVLPPNLPATNAGPAPSDACKYVWARFLDAAGNTSTPSLEAVDSVLLDTLAPDAPNIETASGTVDADTVTIRLRTNARDHFLRGYEMRSANNVAWTPVTSSNACETSGGSCTFVVPLAQYVENRIGLRAVDLAGNASAEDFVTILEDSLRPFAVTALAAEAGNGEVSLRWEAPENSPDVAGYEVLYGPASSFDPADYVGTTAGQGASPVDVGRATSFRLTNLPLGTPVWVAVRAYDSVGPGTLTKHPVALVPDEVTPLVAATVPMSSGTSTRAVVARNGIAYLAHGCFSGKKCGGTGLSTYDLSDPAHPVLLGTVGEFRQALDVTLLGNRAYVANGPTIEVVDISDPRNLTLVRSVSMPPHASGANWAMSVAATPGNLFVAGERNGLVVFDLSDPDKPTFVTANTGGGAFSGTHTNSGANIVRVQGRYAYVTSRHYLDPSAMVVFDVSTPSVPLIAGRINDLPAWAIAIDGDRIFAARNLGLQVYRMVPNTATPPTVSASIAGLFGQANAVALAGPYAITTDRTWNRSNLVVTSLRDLGATTPKLWRAGTASLTANPGDPTLCPTFVEDTCSRPDSELNGNPARFAISRNYLLEANPSSGLVVWRLSKPQAPRVLSTTGLLPAEDNGSYGVGRGLELYGNHLVQGRGGTVALIDVSNPAAPKQGPLVTALGPGNTSSVSTVTLEAGGYLYVTTSCMIVSGSCTPGVSLMRFAPHATTGLTVEPVTNFTGMGPGRHPLGVAPLWPHLYVVDSSDWATHSGGRLRIVDARTMTSVGTTAGFGAGGGFMNPQIQTWGRWIYTTTANGNDGVLVFEAATPATPTVRPTINVYAQGLALFGTRLFAPGGFLSVYSLAANPSAPTWLGTSGVAEGTIAVSGPYAYAPKEPGLLILDVSTPSAPRLNGLVGDTSAGMGVTVVGKHVFWADKTDLQVAQLE